LKTDEPRACGFFLLRPTRALAVAAVVLACLVTQFNAVQAESPKRSQFSRAEINWATTWINSALPNFMQKGIIAKISTKDDGFQVFAGKPWYQLTFTQQGEFLKNLSRAREIIGHSPQFSVVDVDSSMTLGRVSGAGIEVLTPDVGGFRIYEPPADTAAEPQAP
jgi:hypothetical protein